MALTPKGFKKTDPTADGAKVIAQYILEDSQDNMDLADKLITDVEKSVATTNTKVDKHVTIGQVSKSNFDFIRSKVVDDGLINFFEGLYLENVSKTISVGNVADFTVQMKFSLDKAINTRVLSFGDYFALAISNTNISIFDVSVVASIDYKNFPLELSFTKTGNNALLTVNGVSVSSVLKSNYPVSSIVINSGVNREKMNIDYIAIYNRILDPQEMQHNLQFINNSPSISQIATTNTDGTKSPYKLASDSEHVVMRNGYNAEECLSGIYDMCKKEFVSTDGSAITIPNAIDKSKVIRMEIKGRTAVFKRLKGVDDEWIEIESSESRDTSTYDYKLDSVQAIISIN